MGTGHWAVGGCCRQLQRPFKEHVWTTTRQTLPSVTQGRPFFKNNCNIDVTRQIVRYIRALMRWRRTSLGVTVSLPNTSLTGNLAINSTRPSRCAAWGPLVSTTVINRKKAAGATEKDAARRKSCRCDPVLLCKVLGGRHTTSVTRGETIVSGWISTWCTAASCGGRRRIAGKKRRYEWTLEKEMRPKRLKKKVFYFWHTLTDNGSVYSSYWNELTALEYSRFTKDTFSC